MAQHHEKFKDLPPGINETQICYLYCSSNCSVICSPPCPPLSYFSPPPPPFPPPILIDQQSDQHLSPLVIILVALLTSAFLLISCFAIAVKYLCNRSTRSGPTAPLNNTHEDHDQTPNPMDLIWYVRTVGLDESVINSITICKYKRGEGLIEGTECSVCLNEFHEDEDLRLLPKCSHAFHLPCIDTWLKSHVNCPLCRANVVANPVMSSATDPNSISSDSVEESQMGNSQIHIEMSSNMSNGVEGNQGFGDVDGAELGDLGPPCVNRGFRAQSDLIDNHRFGQCAIVVEDDDIQQVRRSISMDSSAAAMIVISMANPPSIDFGGISTAIGAHSTGSKKTNLGESSGLKRFVPKNGWNQGILKTVGNCSQRSFLQMGPILMKRSFSGGGKFFLTRNGRSRSAVLPL